MDIEKFIGSLGDSAVLGGIAGLMAYGFYWGLGVFFGWPELDFRHITGIIVLCALIGACLGGGDYLYWYGIRPRR